MPLRLVIFLCLACGVVAAAAGARTGQQYTAPKCEAILSINDAKDAMNEPEAALVQEELRGHTRECGYLAGPKGGPASHVLGIGWGPYSDTRIRLRGWTKHRICPYAKQACKALKQAIELKSGPKSFAAYAKGLSKVGHVQRLHSFDGNPAFLWRPDDRLPVVSQSAWVEVYVSDLHFEILSYCSDRTDQSPDISCAVAAAKHIYENVTS